MKQIIYTIIPFLFPLLASTQQFYIKGQVKDEGGTALQNVTMLLHSNGYLYKSGSDGSFGILTPSKFDTVTIFREGYNKEKRVINADKFNNIVLKKAVVIKTITPNKLASLTQNLNREEQQLLFTGDETYASIVENNFINAKISRAYNLLVFNDVTISS